MVQLVPVYHIGNGTRQKVNKVEIKSWTPDATKALQDCFEFTDWAVLMDIAANLEEAADTVTDYICLCEELIIHKKTVNIFPNNKPWVTQ